ncbi:MAG TPA: nuclear transport factor 2 family protein [Pyrinomonadaceae bacterium]|nr:nuclear transport factor 2 family protein [Acidobacteriota bacterium]HQZ95926.1 nuclear transport factor 2 family protein [Pyrinomonadaceae bacterium]
MNRRYLVIASIFMFSLAAFAHGQTSEMDAVKIPLENYVKAHATGDPEFARKAFHTEGNMTFVRDGKYVTETFDAFIKRAFTGKPAADEDKRKDHRRFGKIEIVGTAATATIILEYPTVKFTDFMTLLKFNGEWKIVNKSFYAEPKPAIELKKN